MSIESHRTTVGIPRILHPRVGLNHNFGSSYGKRINNKKGKAYARYLE